MNDQTCNISCYAFVLSFVFSSLCITEAVQLHPLAHFVPKGAESVNGSHVDGGCEVKTTMRLCGIGKISFLTDGIIPVFNTTDPNWASELVTVRKNSVTAAIPYDHVVLTFVFQKPQLLKSVKLNLFKCPQWGIGAPNITVYGKASLRMGNFDFDIRDSIIPLAQSQDVQSSCDSLVPVTIPLQTGEQYLSWYIVVSFEPQPAIDWVHVGEVQFFGTPPPPPPSTSTETTPISGDAKGDSSPTIVVVVGVVVGGTVCVVTVLLLLLLLVIIILVLVHKRRSRARATEKEKEDPFYDYVLPPHMPAIPLSGDSVQLKENTAYNTTEAVTSLQVQPNIAYGTILN